MSEAIEIDSAAAWEQSVDEIKNLELLIAKIVTAVRTGTANRASATAIRSDVEALLAEYDALPGIGAVARCLGAGAAAMVPGSVH